MPERFLWSDYDLSGPITLSPEDYTFRAFGLETFYEKTLHYLKKAVEKGCRGWMISGLLGEGKSTFVYNLCHKVNNSFYFEDDLENQRQSEHHILSIYVNKPKPKSLLLEQTIAEGFPIPWDPFHLNRFDMLSLRESLLAKGFRKLAYLLFRAVMCDSEYMQTFLETKKDIPSQLRVALANDQLKTNDLMKIIDHFGKYSVYSELQYSLALWLQNQVRTAAISDMAGLIFPCETQEFIRSLTSLRDSYNRHQWQFDDFLAICRLSRSHVLLAIDELEDWTMAIKSGLDEQLLSMTQENGISMILVLRTLFPKGIKKGKSFDTYLRLFNRLEEFRIPEFDIAQVVQLTEGVLQTSRMSKKPSTLPFTRDFIFSLAARTRRGGRFNPRLYIKCLNEILERSLEIPREEVELSDSLLSATWMRDIIADTLIAEAKKQKEILSDRTLLIASASGEIADYVLIKGICDRQSFDKLKFSTAKKWRCRIPSDFEILASVEDKFYRRRLQHIIESLK
jgi:hypothetical protein